MTVQEQIRLAESYIRLALKHGHEAGRGIYRMLPADHGLTYDEFLTTPFWTYLAQEAKARDRCCVECGSDYRLEAHHKRYPPNVFDVTVDDLVTLCLECHAKHHGKPVRDRRHSGNILGRIS